MKSDYASGIRLLDCSKLALNWKKDNGVTIYWHDLITKFFDVALFPLSDLVTGSSFMSISSLVLKLWQFSFIRHWPEIKKSEIPSPKFFPTSGDWSELGIPNLARIFRTTCYWMMQNVMVTAFTFLSYYVQRWCK